MNMSVLLKSRKKIEQGSIFTINIVSSQYHYGRVIDNNIIMRSGNALLVYIYRITSTNITMLPNMNRNDLLLPPLLVHRCLWTSGYFMSILNAPISKRDILLTHYFYSPVRKKYYDEHGNELQHTRKQCAVYGIAYPGIVDDLLSDALGIPRSAESIAFDRKLDEKRERMKKKRQKMIEVLAKTAKGRNMLKRIGVIE